jgi:hypothetical protein
VSSLSPTLTNSQERSGRRDGAGHSRWRAIDSTAGELVLLFLLIVAATALYLHYALRVGSFQPDEWYYMQLAHYVAGHFPSGLWQEGIWFRGVQRLDQLILALPFAVARGASVYELGHLIQAFLYASTALPVWLLARAGGLGRCGRALATILALVTPWAIVSTSFLAESAAYPIYAWALYATWRAARASSPISEVLAIVAFVLAALSRTALIALVPLLPLAILWQEWRWELRELRWRERFRALPRSLWSRHRIVTVIVSVAIVVLVIGEANLLPGGGLAVLAGKYGLPHLGNVGNLLERYGEYLSRMAMGTGLIALVLGIGWSAQELLRPRDGSQHALAVVSVLGVAMILLSLVQGGPDERYVLYSSVPIGLAFAAEIDARLRSGSAAVSLRRALSVLGGAAVVMVLVATATWASALDEYDFFSYPSATFYRRAVLERVTKLNLPLVHSHVSVLVLVVIAVVAFVWIGAGRVKRLARPAAAVFAVLVVALCATELVYSLDKFTTSAAAQADGTDAAKRSWLESKLAPGTEVAAVAIGLGEDAADFAGIWETSEFWNTDVQTSAAFRPSGVFAPPIGGAERLFSVGGPSGRLRSEVRGAPGDYVEFPRYLLLPREGTNPYGFAGKVVAEDPYLPLELLRTDRPARLEWSLRGTSEEGFMAPRKPAVVTVYDNALEGGSRCASLALISPPGFSGRWRYVVSGGSRAVHGSFSAQQLRKVEVPLRSRQIAGGDLAKVSIRVRGQVPYANGSVVSAQIADVSVGACSHASR